MRRKQERLVVVQRKNGITLGNRLFKKFIFRVTWNSVFARELHLLCGQTSHSFVADLREMYLPEGECVNFRRHRRLQTKLKFFLRHRAYRVLFLFLRAALNSHRHRDHQRTRYLYFVTQIYVHQALLRSVGSSLTLKVCAFIQNVCF